MRPRRIGILLALALLILASCRDPNPTPTPFISSTQEIQPTVTPVLPTATVTPEPTELPNPIPSPSELPQDDVVSELSDDFGVVNISGVVTYTNPFFTLGVAAPVIILEDQTGFVDRNRSFLMPVESQALGQITSDFLTSPFSYNLSLPIEPQGTYRDVDQDGEEEIGVQIFAVAYWNNIFGDPFLEERDLGGGGWSTAYASTKVSDDPETEREIVGGRLLVFAPDDEQGFPSGFGPDGLLFTSDDPTVTLPRGYTIVNMDTDPFTFDRSQDQVVDLIEPEDAALVDYSDLSYTEAFDRLVEQLRNEYAFTEYKGIDWEALKVEFRPRFEAAEAGNNAQLYREALRDFAWSIPDGHIAGPFLIDSFREAASGGIGIAIRELDDGRILANFLLSNGPADIAGMELGAEIITVNGLSAQDHVSNTISHFAPYSTDHSKRLDQLLFATRFPVGAEVVISFLNPGSSEPQTATLEAVPEFESFNFWLQDGERDGFELPVEYDLVEGGFGYVQIFSFSDNDLLTVQLWERMIQAMNENGVPGLIVDMRQNGGGRGFLADQMAAYFFDEPLILGNTGSYDEDRGEFYFDPQGENRFYLPAEELRYDGDVAVLVGPNCASACEFFAYDLTLQDRAEIVGHYPTAGLGGSIDRVAMPEDEEFTFTRGRAVDSEGRIHIEGIGVIPDIRVPVTETSILGDVDVVLATAVDFLAGLVDGGVISLGDEITGSIAPGLKTRYLLALSEGDVISIILEANTDMILSFYDEAGNLLGTREGKSASLEEFEVPFDINLVLEISVDDDQGADQFTLSVIDASG